MTTNLMKVRYDVAEFFFGVEEATANLANVESMIYNAYDNREDMPTRMALVKYLSGEQPSFSSDLLDELTAGYGELSEYGEWEFPLPPKFIYRFLVKKVEV